MGCRPTLFRNVAQLLGMRLISTDDKNRMVLDDHVFLIMNRFDIFNLWLTLKSSHLNLYVITGLQSCNDRDVSRKKCVDIDWHGS